MTILINGISYQIINILMILFTTSGANPFTGNTSTVIAPHAQHLAAR